MDPRNALAIVDDAGTREPLAREWLAHFPTSSRDALCVADLPAAVYEPTDRSLVASPNNHGCNRRFTAHWPQGIGRQVDYRPCRRRCRPRETGAGFQSPLANFGWSRDRIQ